MIGLPGDFTPPSRFVREAIFSKTAVPSKTAQSGVEQIFYILNNFDIPVGVSRTVSDQVVHTEYTMLTVAWDPQSLRYYYRSYADQTIRMIDLKQHDPNAQAIMLISTTGQQPIVDMTKQVK